MRNRKTNIKTPYVSFSFSQAQLHSYTPGPLAHPGRAGGPGCGVTVRCRHFSLLLLLPHTSLCSCMDVSMSCSPVRENQLQCVFSMGRSSFGNIHLPQCRVLCAARNICSSTWSTSSDFDVPSANCHSFFSPSPHLSFSSLSYILFHRHTASFVGGLSCGLWLVGLCLAQYRPWPLLITPAFLPLLKPCQGHPVWENMKDSMQYC